MGFLRTIFIISSSATEEIMKKGSDDVLHLLFKYQYKSIGFMDSLLGKNKIHYRPSFEATQALLSRHRHKPLQATLFSRGKRMERFFTNDSKRYVSAYETYQLEKGCRHYEAAGRFDSVHVRFVSSQDKKRASSEILYQKLRQDFSGWSDAFFRVPDMLRLGLSPAKAWNVSLVAAVFVGMFSMTLIYRYLGQQALATEYASPEVLSSKIIMEAQVLGVSDTKDEDTVYAERLVSNLDQDVEKSEFEREVRSMVKGYPIEAMLPYILQKDRTVAAFMIGIAKKESNWGKRVPVLDGKDCYNYWGYRAIRDRMGTGGHTCFDSPQDAVDSVAKRIQKLVDQENLNTPAKMIVWKCGYSCAGHSRESVRKWISDVDMYFHELNKEEE